jgi:hypothetical protein
MLYNIKKRPKIIWQFEIIVVPLHRLRYDVTPLFHLTPVKGHG